MGPPGGVGVPVGRIRSEHHEPFDVLFRVFWKWYPCLFVDGRDKEGTTSTSSGFRLMRCGKPQEPAQPLEVPLPPATPGRRFLPEHQWTCIAVLESRTAIRCGAVSRCSSCRSCLSPVGPLLPPSCRPSLGPDQPDWTPTPPSPPFRPPPPHICWHQWPLAAF